MSVNGSGLDRKTQKPRNDSTNWTVRTPSDPTPIEYTTSKREKKVAKGMNAADAFALVRQRRRTRGEYLVAVRG